MTGNNVHRLPAPWGSLLNRDEPVEFKFDGSVVSGYVGDTVTSALAANGRFVLSRSFKYHRPRGSVSLAGWDANSYVQIGNEPNVPADLYPAGKGIVVSAQNVLGSLDRDYGAGASIFKRFLPVGFYYRAFFRPRGIWMFWERFIRKASGLGRINTNAGHESYCDKKYLFTDVAVIGAGPAGLSAALEAAGMGASVLLIEESPVIGGSLNYARFGKPRKEVDRLRDSLVDAVQQNDRIRVLTDVTCSGWFADNWLSLNNSRRLFKVRARRVVLATGSVEQPAVFRNNDVPGVLPASAVQRLLRLYGVRPGKRAVVITSNTEGFDVASDLIEAGVAVAAIADVSLAGVELAADDETNVIRDLLPMQVRPTRGNKGVAAIDLAAQGETSVRMSIECDLVVTSIGYAPLGQLACHDGGHLAYDNTVQAFRIGNCPDGGDIAGSVNHSYTLDAVLADGKAAGQHAAASLRVDRPSQRKAVTDPTAAIMNHPYPIYSHPQGGEYLDFDEDQTIHDLENAVADGFDHPELAKRYSTAAMGPSQGRLSATNALRVVTRASGSTGLQVTTQRPPFRPVPFRVLAGRILEPERLTPMHDWHTEHGAVHMPVGQWQRPAYYASRESREQSIECEVAAIRNAVGLIDISTLGGIEIRGPDAAEFLNRMYTFAYTRQAVERIRYVLMTDETGSIVDDGVACRLGDEHFYVTTTTTGSDAVYRTMLKRVAEWRLEVDLCNVTAAFAAMNLAGPRTRDVLNGLNTDIDFSARSFPYLAARSGYINNIPVRAMRVGFVGELGLELHVPSSRALELWKVIMAAGQPAEIRPVGVEAQRVLRLEKGHIIVGQDTDGLTNPGEAGMSWAVSSAKPYFIGRAAVSCLGGQVQTRKLVGFELPTAEVALPEECNLVLRDGDIAGRVTSIAHSATLDRVIGLAYAHPDDSSPGSRIVIKGSKGNLLEAQVVELPFLDADGLRQEA